ncbi:MAG: thiamine phosphate synthase, partial [Phycisphaerae bacterium]
MKGTPMDSTDRLMVLRILDANMNRAREALRVLEEHCRFVLDDTSLCEETKAIRHEVSRLLGDGGSTYEDGLVARDIVGDVGKEVESGQEYVRENASSVAVAAARRASEAIRA